MKPRAWNMVPFNGEGSMRGWASNKEGEDSYSKIPKFDVIWRKAEPFRAKLKTERSQRGRSSSVIIFKDEEGHEYQMFIKNAVEMLKQVTILNGEIEGIFDFAKRGQNFGIKWVSNV